MREWLDKNSFPWALVFKKDLEGDLGNKPLELRCMFVHVHVRIRTHPGRIN